MTPSLFGPSRPRLRMRVRMRGVAWLVLGLAAASLNAQDRRGKDISVGPAAFRGSKASARVAKEPPAAADVARARATAARLPASARHALGPLSASDRARLSGAGDRDGRGRAKGRVIGIVRKLEGATDGYVETRDGRTIWAASFASEGAAGIRLRVEAPGLPDGSRAYVFAAGGAQIHGPYSATMLARSGGFWTNTIFADEAFLEIALPDGASLPAAPRIRVSAVGHVDRERAFPRGGAKDVAGAPQEDCPLDLQCVSTADFPLKNEASRGVAMIYYEAQGFLGQCTGTLLNTTLGPVEPYLLTANHCFSSPASAASVEAFWSYVTPSCGAFPPDPATFESSLGSTVLATESATNGADFTFLLLDEDPPPDSIFLGWTTEDLAEGTPLHRISHPEGLPQSYSHNAIAPYLSDCTDMQADQEWPSIIDRGMTLGGSSGAALMTGDLEVVGQLWGGCGLCGTPVPQTRDNDGRFSESFAALAQYLDPDTPAPCVASPTTLCLNDGRFRVVADWRRVNGDTGVGQAVPLTSDSGYFWFFNSANIELVVKVLDACTVNDHYWVFAGGLTNVEVVLTVTDTNTGAQQVYTNPLGTAYVPLQDTGAFECP